MCYAAELSVYWPRRKIRYSERTERRANYHLALLMDLPTFAWWACSILVFVQIFVKPDIAVAQQGCTVKLDVKPDIGGSGVRIALMLMMAMASITLMLGACGYCGETGAKELGIACLVSK
jgi:hypothetical protein